MSVVLYSIRVSNKSIELYTWLFTKLDVALEENEDDRNVGFHDQRKSQWVNYVSSGRYLWYAVAFQNSLSAADL